MSKLRWSILSLYKCVQQFHQVADESEQLGDVCLYCVLVTDDLDY